MAHRRSLSLELDYGDDPDMDHDAGPSHSSPAAPAPAPAPPSTSAAPSSSSLPAAVPGLPANPLTGVRPTAVAPPAHHNGTAPSSSAGATTAKRLTAVYLSDLHWVRPPSLPPSSPPRARRARLTPRRGARPQWTSDADIVHLCALAGLDVPFRDVVFADHKVNGKSKGCVPLSLSSSLSCWLLVS